MRRHRTSGASVALGALLSVASACGSTPPSRFYALTPVDAAADATPLELCVHLAVVELPAYLSGPEIVTRSGESQVLRADFERWAEPLESAFARVLAWDLARLVPSERVFRAPWERPGPTDLALTVAVQRFDVQDGQAHLEAVWKLSRSVGEPALVLRRARHARPVEGEGYGAIAAALSGLLGELAAEVAAEIRASPRAG